MTNLDSLLKSRDITLQTKVCLVIVMVFPVVMYEYESWTIKKAEYIYIYLNTAFYVYTFISTQASTCVHVHLMFSCSVMSDSL